MNEQRIVQEVTGAEIELSEAHLNLDLDVFNRLLHPDYVIIQPGGVIEGKAETMASLRAGGRLWEIARSDEMDVCIYGDTAVVIGRWRGKGQNAGELFDYSARFLSVWVREDSQWRNVAAQSTPIDKPVGEQE